MDRKAILLKNPADWTEAEQLSVIENTDNSLTDDDLDLDQPPQDPDWKPDPKVTVKSIDA